MRPSCNWPAAVQIGGSACASLPSIGHAPWPLAVPAKPWQSRAKTAARATAPADNAGASPATGEGGRVFRDGPGGSARSGHRWPCRARTRHTAVTQTHARAATGGVASAVPVVSPACRYGVPLRAGDRQRSAHLDTFSRRHGKLPRSWLGEHGSSPSLRPPQAPGLSRCGLLLDAGARLSGSSGGIEDVGVPESGRARDRWIRLGQRAARVERLPVGVDR